MNRDSSPLIFRGGYNGPGSRLFGGHVNLTRPLVTLAIHQDHVEITAIPPFNLFFKPIIMRAGTFRAKSVDVKSPLTSGVRFETGAVEASPSGPVIRNRSSGNSGGS